ncbi:MAG: aminotransferase class V-fold PLP-dependent enzyme [Acidobacteriota bacterium]|nr:aminotransferase class V-fold PLP-dependent enzyme [Acidobacteriota bacterium]MDE3191300.1 aminotransferase class V-fold PLP-dependent enzyme [Acidobacteriota bacterium]
MTFDEARAQFPVLDAKAYLNAGTNGPLARATIEAVNAQNARDLVDGRSGKAYIEEMLELREQVRAGIAGVIGVEPPSLALTDSTTRGCAAVLAGLGLSDGDEVVTTDQEHFGLTGPLHATGARVVVVEADEEAIAHAVTPRTKLVATSHILWTTGRRLDVARVREDTGVPILVDGAQSSGAVRVDVGPVDFYTVSAQKWLCGPEATGALYVADPERLRVTSPSYLSQDAYEASGAFVPKEGAKRFDSGWIPSTSVRGLLAALGTRPEWCYDRAAETAARCREQLEGVVEVVTPPGHSTLVSFRPNGDPAELVAALDDRGVVVRELPGRNLVRASVGWWTSDGDLQRLRAGLA